VAGVHACVAHIYARPCSDATARCTAGQSCRQCSYSAREARRRASRDDEASVVPLTVGHAASHAPSRRPRSPPPPPWTGFGSGALDENIRRAGWKKCIEGTTGRDFLRRRPQMAFEGPLGASEDALRRLLEALVHFHCRFSPLAYQLEK
jgi:hypothetical protein